jgi:hypothetical protein
MTKYRTADPEYQARIDKIHDTDISIGKDRYQIRVLRDCVGSCCVMLDPYDGSGDVAESDIGYDSYEYTHGGVVYQHAVQIAKDFDQYISGNACTRSTHA